MPSCSQRVGTPNAQHNMQNSYRKHLENVNPELTKYNEIIRQKSIEEIYQEHLQPAFDKFNEKQKRNDRRLDVKYNCDTYLGYQRALDKQAQASDNAIDKKGRPPIRELILQIGNPEQGYGCAGQTDESRRKIFGMLKEMQAEIENRYPQLIFGDSVIHADEDSLDADGKRYGSIHIHSSFVPLCFDNKRGPEVQVAFERCLKEMGFSSFEAWKHDLDNVMETVLQKHGLERTVMNNTEEHQESKEFHRQQKAIKETRELEQKQEAAKEKLEELGIEIENLQEVQSNAQELVQNAVDEVLEARQELSKVEFDVEALKGKKTELEGNLRHLQARSGYECSQIEMIQQRKTELQQEYIKLERELPALRSQIGEAKGELELVETAIKRKKEDARELFRSDNLDAVLERTRKETEKDKKIKSLETRLSIFERFVSLPQIQPLWEKFLHLLQRDTEKEKKKTKMLSQDEQGGH